MISRRRSVHFQPSYRAGKGNLSKFVSAPAPIREVLPEPYWRGGRFRFQRLQLPLRQFHFEEGQAGDCFGFDPGRAKTARSQGVNTRAR